MPIKHLAASTNPRSPVLGIRPAATKVTPFPASLSHRLCKQPTQELNMLSPYWLAAFCHTRNRQQAARPASSASARIVLALLWPLLPATAWTATTTTVVAPATVAGAAQATIQFSQSKTPGAELQLNVKQALLADIIKEVAAKTKVDIHYSVLPETPVTATCVAGKVQALLECLVGKQIGVVSQKPEGSPQEQVWLLGSSMGGCPAATAKSAAEPEAVAPPTPAEQAEIERGIRQQTAAMLKQLKSKDANDRANAIGNLANLSNADPAIDKALQQALNDEDSNVRAQSVYTIAQRGDQNAMGQALQDSSANVRMAVISVADADSGLLQQALSDSDPEVRGLAQSRIAELERIAAKQNQ